MNTQKWLIAAAVVIGGIVLIVALGRKPAQDKPCQDGKCILPVAPLLKTEDKKPEEKSGPDISAKNILYVFHAEWCAPCKKMERMTFGDKDVKNALQKYNVIHVDTDKQPELKAKYKVTGIPAYVIVSPTDPEKILKSGEGYKGPLEFRRWLP